MISLLTSIYSLSVLFDYMVRSPCKEVLILSSLAIRSVLGIFNVSVHLQLTSTIKRLHNGHLVLSNSLRAQT